MRIKDKKFKILKNLKKKMVGRNKQPELSPKIHWSILNSGKHIYHSAPTNDSTCEKKKLFSKKKKKKILHVKIDYFFSFFVVENDVKIDLV